MSPSKPQQRGLLRRQAMMDAATELFLSKGYVQTSLSDILERSKGSRSTLYEQFGSKEGLLKAIIERSLAEVMRAFDGEQDITELTEEVLADLGLRILRRVIEPRALGVFRLLVSEGQHMPEVSHYANECCQRNIDGKLAEIFSRHLPVARDNCAVANELATFFLWTVTGDVHFQHAVGAPPPADEAEQERLIRLRVRLFLHGINGIAS